MFNRSLYPFQKLILEPGIQGKIRGNRGDLNVFKVRGGRGLDQVSMKGENDLIKWQRQAPKNLANLTQKNKNAGTITEGRVGQLYTQYFNLTLEHNSGIWMKGFD